MKTANQLLLSSPTKRKGRMMAKGEVHP
ncbi:hypothetical protein Anas_12592 [Armadillidium nasatum]|uniref:Uncharacterized protein n=1 Tax=Armadillidium nasatum TaxID=96803 RepID=A0A5N5SQU7_9CRUS|nr:hypothetical protein Anas_12592 [Armadillidium nasatum]